MSSKIFTHDPALPPEPPANGSLLAGLIESLRHLWRELIAAWRGY
jgi:hypothetical protein